MTGWKNREFEGAKLALLLGGQLLVIRRDDRPDIAWPGYLDLPGGGREGQESPEACVLRETLEEVGLALAPQDLIWKRFYPDGPIPAWFFGANQPENRTRDIVFGDEGQGWLLMPPEEFVARAEAVPHFRLRVREFLQDAG